MSAPLKVKIAGSIPRVQFQDLSFMDYVKKEMPVVIENSGIIGTASGKWTMEYLRENIGPKEDFEVFYSPSPRFMYSDYSKNTGNYTFYPETYKLKTSFPRFYDLSHELIEKHASSGQASEKLLQPQHSFASTLLRNPDLLRGAVLCPPSEKTTPDSILNAAAYASSSSSSSSSSAAPPALPEKDEASMTDKEKLDARIRLLLAKTERRSALEILEGLKEDDLDLSKLEYVYMQHTLTEGIGEKVAQDYKSFKWEWLLGIQQAIGLGRLKASVLWCGIAGCVSPLHYDEALNFFAQCVGQKRFILFDPAQYTSLYPYPVHHACDRQSQVNPYEPDLENFPRFAEAAGVECILNPGDILFLPPYWWHHVESITTGTGVNFWFEPGKTSSANVVFPLNPTQLMAVRRNTEMFISAVVPSQEIGTFFHDLAADRFTHIPGHKK